MIAPAVLLPSLLLQRSAPMQNQSHQGTRAFLVWIKTKVNQGHEKNRRP